MSFFILFWRAQRVLQHRSFSARQFRYHGLGRIRWSENLSPLPKHNDSKILGCFLNLFILFIGSCKLTCSIRVWYSYFISNSQEEYILAATKSVMMISSYSQIQVSQFYLSFCFLFWSQVDYCSKRSKKKMNCLCEKDSGLFSSHSTSPNVLGCPLWGTSEKSRSLSLKVDVLPQQCHRTKSLSFQFQELDSSSTHSGQSSTKLDSSQSGNWIWTLSFCIILNACTYQLVYCHLFLLLRLPWNCSSTLFCNRNEMEHYRYMTVMWSYVPLSPHSALAIG